MRLVATLALIVGCATTLSCKVNEFCLNCETGDGGLGDGGDGDANDGGDGDAPDADPCVPTGLEVCDDKDNDCDGNVDEGPLPEVGDSCANQVGECAGGVKVCVTGLLKCSKNPAPELCDTKDNDCNGLTDEGDPGGGAKCGTDVGECVAGTLHCNTITGTVQCQGAIGGIMPPFGTAETCDGRDNDCDNLFDEGIGALGSCGGGPGPDPNAGICQQGTLVCVGGGTICMGDQGPQFEACDTLDNDCDGASDEDTNKLTDPQNCGSCGFVCSLPNAFEGCAGGTCTIASCQQNFHDDNGTLADGCEYACTVQSSVEICNGIDDDCRTATSEATLPPPANFCAQGGACAGATASCQGADGFVCNYGTDVELDGTTGNITSETRCDGIDNDCDGRVDESHPNLGQACSDSGLGVCKGTGTFQCAANPTGPAVCVITQPGTTADPVETCDGKDNDCDGLVDEGAVTGDLAGQEWVVVPGITPAVEIMKYEASRPDATASGSGTNQAFACSKQNVLPWTNVKHDQAETACASIGARLCSETEWQRMCDPAPTYPIAGPLGTDFAFAEAETPFAVVAGNVNGGNDNWVLQQPPTQLQDFSGTGARQVLLDNGTVLSGVNAPANSARLDFQFSLAGATAYTVWARIMGVSAASDSIHLGLNATAPGAVNAGSLLSGPLNVWVWVRAPGQVTTGAAGNYLVSAYANEDGTRIDMVAITRSNSTTPPALDERTWAYQSNQKVAQAQVCNGDEFDTNPGLAGDQDDIRPTGSLAACFANGPGGSDAFDMSGNVKEWAAERAAGQNPLRGGSSNNEVDGLTCGLNFTLADDTFFFPNVGFRCCRLQ